MLRIHVGESIEPLAARLAERLAKPGPNPLATELVAVPTGAMNRWLKLSLANRLGVSAGRSDGVTANIDVVFPGSIRSRLLGEFLNGSDDPWELERLVWTVLDLIRDPANEAELGPMALPPVGTTWYSRARSAADLLDRYGVHRPQMVLDWAEGHDTDGIGELLPSSHLWQPRLWRLVRQQIGEPGPAERTLALIADPLPHSDLIRRALPARISVFGSTSIPGGSVFLDLASALGRVIEVDLYIVAPSVVDPDGPHPLLGTWARPASEASQLLRQSSTAADTASPTIETVPSPPSPRPGSLLAQLAADVRLARTPTTGLRADPSVQIHRCYGPTRQLEAARDAILAALDDDPTLDESDITVLIPQLASVAPLVPGVFGPPARSRQYGPSPDGNTRSTPPIDYVITDRSIETPQPYAQALLATLDLLASRCTRSEMIGYLSLGPVSTRFGLDGPALAQIERWAADAEIRWGLNPRHRARWGLPAELTTNTWRHGIDQFLMGIALFDDGPVLATDDLGVEGVEGDQVLLIGSVGQALSGIEALADEISAPRTAPEWASWARSAGERMLAVTDDDAWQAERVNEQLEDLAERASSSASLLDFSEFSLLMTSTLASSPGRSRFFAGGVTVTSMVQMRWLPTRVTIIVGLDDTAFSVSPKNGDDLVSAHPQLGDIDGRNERRQGILESILSTSDRLVIIRSGFRESDNTTVPPAVTVAELIDVLTAMTDGAFTETSHARQVFDPRHLDPNQPRLATFDPIALEAGLTQPKPALATAFLPPASPDPAPSSIPTVDLGTLRSFLRYPSRRFFEDRLSVRLDRETESSSEDIDLDLDALAAWELGRSRLESGLTEEEWSRYQSGRGRVPPGIAGSATEQKILSATEAIRRQAEEALGAYSPAEPLPVDVTINGSRIVGTIGSIINSDGNTSSILHLTYSRVKPKSVLQLWLDLVVASVAEPDVRWVGHLVGRNPKTGNILAVHHSLTLRPGAATDSTSRLLALFETASNTPIPLFADSSYGLANGGESDSYWMPFGHPGEAQDPYNAEAWGAESLSTLLRLPTVPGDPGHPSQSRFVAYAEALWSIVDSSVSEALDV